jgi:hypothetical protein
MRKPSVGPQFESGKNPGVVGDREALRNLGRCLCDWVVTAEVIRDDGTRETVELGSVPCGPLTAPPMWG